MTELSELVWRRWPGRPRWSNAFTRTTYIRAIDLLTELELLLLTSLLLFILFSGDLPIYTKRYYSTRVAVSHAMVCKHQM